MNQDDKADKIGIGAMEPHINANEILKINRYITAYENMIIDMRELSNLSYRGIEPNPSHIKDLMLNDHIHTRAKVCIDILIISLRFLKTYKQLQIKNDHMLLEEYYIESI